MRRARGRFPNGRYLVSIVSQRSQLTLQVPKSECLSVCSERRVLDKDEMEWPPKERGVSVRALVSLVFFKGVLITLLAVWLVWLVWLVWRGRGK